MNTDPLEHFLLRDLAGSLISLIATKYSHSSHTLRPRLARTFVKNFLDPGKPFGTHYGSIIGLQAIGGPDVVRELIVPNLITYEVVLKDGCSDEGPRKAEAERVIGIILSVLSTLQDDGLPTANGYTSEALDELKNKLGDKIGEVVASRVIDSGQTQLASIIISGR